VSKLTEAERHRLPSSAFAIPETRSYPIADVTHARDALAEVAAHGSAEEKSRVREAVHRRFPSIKEEDLDQ
jgi:hypothetical protein